jgi:post-segregation antitoxin (ccd killing protein)
MRIEARSIGVYTMRMARVNVYLPNDLAAEAKAAGLNVSSLTQEALRSALAASHTDDWLDTLVTLRSTGIGHPAVAAAVATAKDEIEGHG